MKATLSRTNFVNLIFKVIVYLTHVSVLWMSNGTWRDRFGKEDQHQQHQLGCCQACTRSDEHFMLIHWYRQTYAMPSWNNLVVVSVEEVQKDLKQNQIRMISTTMKIPTETKHVWRCLSHTLIMHSHIPRQVVKLSVLSLKSIEPVQERNQSLLKLFVLWCFLVVEQGLLGINQCKCRVYKFEGPALK